MRLLKKIGIFLKFKIQEISKGLLYFILFIGLIALIVGIFYLLCFSVGYIALYFKDLPFWGNLFANDLSKYDIKNFSTISNIGFNLFMSFTLVIFLLIILFALIVFTIPEWLKDNWRKAEHAVRSKENKSKKFENNIQDYEASLIKSNPKPKTKKPKSYKGNKGETKKI